MRWGHILGFTVAALMLPAHAQAFGTTGNTLLTSCGTVPIQQSPANYQTGQCIGYVMGVVDVLDGPIICPSGSTSNGQLVDIVIKHLIDHPETRDRPADNLIYEVATAAFPCPKTKKTSTNESAPHGEDRSSVAAGTAFFVSHDGMALTNAHVVKDCTAFQMRELNGAWETATLIAANEANDLALLQVRTRSAPGIARFRKGDVQLGEGILVFGYPLPGLLASSGNATVGNITALAGIGDDGSLLQVSAPVQPGNSGGPVLDPSGEVVGVVVGKLDASRVASLVNDIPQNVNFAIKGSVATSFLEAHSVRYESASPEAKFSTTSLVHSAQRFTAQIVCAAQ